MRSFLTRLSRAFARRITVDWSMSTSDRDSFGETAVTDPTARLRVVTPGRPVTGRRDSSDDGSARRS
jgi:hypothetical protein